ncbi:MAG: hypothetical protein AAB428_02245 [Patescibacteria group bacterium]
MKISHKLRVLVHRKRTIIETLETWIQKTALKKFAQWALGSEKTKKLSGLIDNQVLSREYEGETTYEKTMALASLERNTLVCGVYNELKELGYYPAGLSETISYLSEAKDVSVGSIVVLGMRLLDDDFKEMRIIIKENGVESETAYPEKPLKQHFQVVVIKEEIATHKK